MTGKYNWWDDPKNKEEVERISWWNHPENKEVFNLPIAVVKSEGGWVATCNSETEKYLGKKLHGCAQGKTKEEAISQMFLTIRITHEFSEQCRLSYQRFVPFRKGNWQRVGGMWFVVFGIHVYFRYGKGMKGGKYIPFTKLNISISNDWTLYRDSKKKKSDDE